MTIIDDQIMPVLAKIACRKGELQVFHIFHNFVCLPFTVEKMSSSSTWDRLAKTETVATAAKKELQRVADQERKDRKKKMAERREKQPEKKTTNAFFDRMSKAETFATVSFCLHLEVVTYFPNDPNLQFYYMFYNRLI